MPSRGRVGSDGLPLGVLRLSDSFADDVLQENLEDTSSLLIDEARNPLDSSSPCEAADGGLGDALGNIGQQGAAKELNEPTH